MTSDVNELCAKTAHAEKGKIKMTNNEKIKVAEALKEALEHMPMGNVPLLKKMVEAIHIMEREDD